MAPALVLSVKVVKCIALRRMNAASSKKADPYVIVQVEDTVASTGVKEHTLEPIYNETFSFEVSPSFMDSEKSQVVVKVCHHEVAHGKLMGQVSIAFKKLVDGTNYLAVHAPGSKTLVGQVVLQVAKAPLVNQYARLRSDFLSYHKGSNTAKPVLAYHKTKPSGMSPSSSPAKKSSPYSQVPPNRSKPGPAHKVDDNKAGGRLNLLKLPFFLGSVAVAGVFGLSAVPENVYSSQLTKWARKVRGDGTTAAAAVAAAATAAAKVAGGHASARAQVAARHTIAGAKWTGARATEIGGKVKALAGKSTGEQKGKATASASASRSFFFSRN